MSRRRRGARQAAPRHRHACACRLIDGRAELEGAARRPPQPHAIGGAAGNSAERRRDAPRPRGRHDAAAAAQQSQRRQQRHPSDAAVATPLAPGCLSCSAAGLVMPLGPCSLSFGRGRDSRPVSCPLVSLTFGHRGHRGRPRGLRTDTRPALNRAPPCRGRPCLYNGGASLWTCCPGGCGFIAGRFAQAALNLQRCSAAAVTCLLSAEVHLNSGPA